MPQNEVTIPVRVVDEFSRTLREFEAKLMGAMDKSVQALGDLTTEISNLKTALDNVGTASQNVRKSFDLWDIVSRTSNIVSLGVALDYVLGLMKNAKIPVKSLSDIIAKLAPAAAGAGKSIGILGATLRGGVIGAITWLGIEGTAHMINLATEARNAALEISLSFKRAAADVVHHMDSLSNIDLGLRKSKFEERLSQIKKSIEQAKKDIEANEIRLLGTTDMEERATLISIISSLKIGIGELQKEEQFYASALKISNDEIEKRKGLAATLQQQALALKKLVEEGRNLSKADIGIIISDIQNNIEKLQQRKAYLSLQKMMFGSEDAEKELKVVNSQIAASQNELKGWKNEVVKIEKAMAPWEAAMKRAGVTAGTVASMEEILLTQAARLHAEIKVNGIKNIANFNDRLVDLAANMKHWHMDLSKLPKDLQQFIRNAQEAANKVEEAAGGFNMFHDALSINIGVALKLAGAFQIMKPFLEEHKRLLKEGEKVTLAFGTAQEKAAILMRTQVKPQLELLEKLHKRGIISTETFVKASTAEYDKLIKQVFPNLKMGLINKLRDKLDCKFRQSHQTYLKNRMIVEKNEEMMDRLNNAA